MSDHITAAVPLPPLGTLSDATADKEAAEVGGASESQGRRRVETLVVIVIVGFTAAVVAHYVAGEYLLLSYPYDTFLFKPYTGGSFGAFSDFYEIVAVASRLNPYDPGTLTGSYFPFAYLLAFPFSLVPDGVNLAIMLSLLVASTVFCLQPCFVMLDRGDARQGSTVGTFLQLFALTFLTYPFLFTADRANFEILVFGFLVLGLWGLTTGSPIVGAIAVGAATAMKGYPALFIVLFLVRRQFRAAAVALGTAAVATGYSLLVFLGDPMSNLHGLRLSLERLELQTLGADLLGTEQGIQHSSSLFSAVAAIAKRFDTFRPLLEPVLRNYTALAAVLLTISVLYILVYERVLWRQVFVVVAMVIILPPVSYDYKLIHVLLVLPIYLHSGDDRRRAFLWVLGLLLIPKSLPILWGTASVAVVMNPLLLAAGTVAIMLSGLRIATEHSPGETMG